MRAAAALDRAYIELQGKERPYDKLPTQDDEMPTIHNG